MRKHVMMMLCVLLATVQLYAQRTVTGKVTDESGTPLAGATVAAGTSVSATTGSSGEFSIAVPSGVKQLAVSYVGFATQNITLSGKNSITVRMVVGANKLDEVVVTGVNRVKRSQYTGAATKVDAKDLNNRPVGSPDQLLQGRVPGVLALTSSGQPGTSATVIIRGQTSAIGGSDPLYVVDGIPVETGVFQGINANDIESMDVLRDASAAALYGSRASAGVIVVTTKRGRSGKMQLSYSVQAGQKRPPHFNMDMMTTPELLQNQEAYGKIVQVGNTTATMNNLPGWYYSLNNPANASLPDASPASDPYSNSKARYNQILDSIRGINTNWRDVFLRNGSFSNHQISLSGGTGKTRLYSSLGLYNEEGVTLRTDMKRVTFKNNVDYADDKLTLSVSSNVAYTKRNFQQSTTSNNLGNPFLVMNVSAPYHPARIGDSIPTGTGNKYAAVNTLELTQLDISQNNQIKVDLSVIAQYKITNELIAGLTTGADFRETQGNAYGNRLAYTRRTSTNPRTKAGSQAESLDRYFSPDIRPSLEFRKTIRDKHDLSVAVYGEYVRQAIKNFSVTGYGIDPRTPNTPGAITPSNQTNLLFPAVTGYKSVNTLFSGLMTGRYTYDGKYTFSASYRRDGSSKLSPEHRWAGFYSVGGVWEAQKEKFLADNRKINLLRVRLSYGSAGSSINFPTLSVSTANATVDYGDYLYAPVYGVGSYSGITTLTSSYPGYPDLKWETTFITNFGIDFAFLKSRIYGDINLYDKRTKDLFVTRTLPSESGFGSLNVNAGELQNKGFEFTLNGEVLRTRDIVWTVFGNVALNRNKVLSLGGDSSFEQGTELVKVGMPLGSHYEVKWGGVDAATGAPLYYNASGKLTTDYAEGQPVQEFGTWEAPWKGGFGTSFRWKGVEVSTLFSWQRGANKSNNLEYFMENPVGFLANGYNQANTLQFWQKPGDVVSTPSPLYSVNFSSKIIHKADFLRWRDVNISYTLPQTALDKLKVVSKLSVFFQAENLAMWTKWRGMDPEAGAVNINTSEFPNPKAFTGGVTVTFK